MNTETAKMLAGEPYDPLDPALVADRERARDLTRRYNRTRAGDDEERRRLLEELFGTGGGSAAVEPPFRCDYGYNLHVGEGFFANFDCVFLDVCRIDVGRNCFVGPGVHLYTATHPLDAEERTSGVESGAPVSIGDDVWMGGRAVLTPGVSVGDRAVVAAGAVVTGDVPDDVVVGGNPARVIQELDGEE